MKTLDTNVLVYFIDTSEPAKRQRAIELVDEMIDQPEPIALMWQVAVEFVAQLRRWENQGRHQRALSEAHLTWMLSAFRILFPSAQILPKSLELSARYSLSHWDGLLLAACLEAGVETLYSEDMQDGMTYDGVRVVNPFSGSE